MNTEATTLYKLMVLYMLSKVNFPLSNSQIADFMLDKQYTTYFYTAGSFKLPCR